MTMTDVTKLNRLDSEEDDHVRSSSGDEVNAKIDARTEENIRRFSGERPEMIEARITELDREWDVERALEMTAASLSLTGVVAGLAGRKRALILPAVVLTFLFQHAVQGWCPPLPVFRRLGFRTRKEIDREKYALKVLRGDFSHR